MKSRIAVTAYYAVPSILCLALYWFGLRTWFLDDDFAWLGLNAQVQDWNSFWHAVFVPTAQGTIRPLSERMFFIASWHMFGWHAFWYRAVVFLTQFFNLVLLSWIVQKLTASRIAGFVAPVLWMANADQAVPMSWSSGYNEVLCASFLLAAFATLLKFQETGRWRYYFFQAAIFIVGFGALELNIVYPAIALVWVLLCARRGKVSVRVLALLTLPLFVISAIYAAVHTFVSPPQIAGPYSMHFDGAIPRTLWTYWKWTFVSPLWPAVGGFVPRLGGAVVWILTTALAAFVLYQTARGRYLPAFFLGWFLVTLAPFVPLRDHVSDYYVALPSLGPAVIAAIAVAAAWRGPAYGKAVSLVLIALYLAVQIPVARASAFWHFGRSSAARDLVLGVARAHQVHPRKAILLTYVSPDLYETAIAHRPFRLIPNTEVYLAPEALTEIRNVASNLAPVSLFVLPPGATARALSSDQMEVYSAAGSRLREMTLTYERNAPQKWWSEYPQRVDVGNRFLEYTLGPSWFPTDGAYRWMPREATVRLGGGTSATQKLFLTGYCPKDALAGGPVRIRVTLDGEPGGVASIDKPEGFTVNFPLPAHAINKQFIDVRVEVNGTLPEKSGERTLAFGVFEIK